jgi:hypothetical protein
LGLAGDSAIFRIAALNLQRFAYNKTFEEAFPDGIRGLNWPTNVRFGPDGCAYVADYGAVRDFECSDPMLGSRTAPTPR